MKIASDTDIPALQTKMESIFKSRYIPYLENRGNVYAEDVKKYRFYQLQPIKDIHLYSKDVYDVFKNSDIYVIYLFGVVAVFILLLACINFINLSTAKSANRAKEVGMRKVVGSSRADLIRQFLFESMITTFIATILGLALAWLLMPYFNVLSGKELQMPFDQWVFIPFISLLILVIGLISGFYPSFYLSSFKPIQVIKGKISRGAKTSFVRNGLVTFQFTCSIVLIVCAVVVDLQMDYILNKDLGFKKEQVVMIQGARTLKEKVPLFQESLRQLPEISSVSLSNYLPVSGTKRDQNSFWNAGKREMDVAIGAQCWNVDEHYLSTLGLELIAGRNFNPEAYRDTSTIIINEAMVKELGLSEPVIGSRIESFREWTVIGVVKDFHFESMKGEITPLSLRFNRFGSIIPVRINDGDLKQTLDKIDGIWGEYMPNQPIRYNFLDHEYERMYEDVSKTGQVFKAFSVLAIIVACLGLFGLSAYMVEQRSKEISIRKVLGASMYIIFRLLTVNFFKLILLSFVIAVPLSFFLMDKWLSDFEYSVNIGWMVFFFAGLLIAVIALITISYESIKAALINPVDGLRSE